MTVMNNKFFRIAGFSLVVATSLLINCDPFQKDLIKQENQVIVNDSAMDYFILPNTSTVIDLKALVSSSFTNVTLTVSENPTFGKLTSLSEFLLKYEPLPTFKEGNDHITVSFTIDNRIILNETLTIHMTQDTIGFPCSLIAVEDSVASESGATILISFLDNDRVCDVNKKDLSTSIYLQPQHGIAALTGNGISYTANGSYVGLDEFVYKISTSDNTGTDGDNILTSYGLISILIGDEEQLVADIDGNVYNTVNIGTQVWMAENLKTTSYRNGDLIGTTTHAALDIRSEVISKYQWAYNGEENNVEAYGRLYTWYVATDSRNVCPVGWHLPTDAEWTILSTFLGGESVAGDKLKESGIAHWSGTNSATNESGFTALPGGYRYYDGTFYSIGAVGMWWSSSEEAAGVGTAWGRYLYTSGGLDRGSAGSGKQHGFSVRCIKD
jgi:uncharacterized protein (TIGR02145 family)